MSASALAVDVTLTATVHDDLRGLHGNLTLGPTLAGATLVDPLALLPEPPDDLALLRTYPGRPCKGQVSWEQIGPHTWAFETRLPRRYDDIGWTREGLFANGAWYPQPTLDGDALPIVDWDVRVDLPADRTGVLGDRADRGSLSWTATADRVPIAVLRRGRLTQLAGDNWSLSLVTAHRARPVLVRELVKTLDALASEEIPLHGAIVEGPLRRRLARPAPSLLYLSDRAYRLTPPLQRFHRAAVARGIATAWSPQADPYLRSVAGAAVGAHHAEALDGIDADRLLGIFRWIPQIHWLLANQRMPFYADVLERPHPSDRVQDDLAELLAPYTPGSVVILQASDRFGEDAGTRLGFSLALGMSVDAAELRAGVDAGWLETWRVAYPDQDYHLTVDKAARQITLERVAPADAPIETATIRVDDALITSTGGPGVRTFDLDHTPRRVILDPAGHMAQDRLGDAWPERYMLTASAGITSINLTRGQVFAAGSVTLRRAYDTHNLYRGVVYNSFSDLAGARLSWLRQEGRRRGAGWSRPHQLTLWTNTSLLNTRFSDTDGLKGTWGGGVSYGWDTRVNGDFPLRGQRLGASASAGLIPSLGESWIHIGPSAVGVVALHPRHTIAAFAEAAVAQANVPHRKLALGGHSVLRSLPSLPACPAVDERGRPAPCQTLADQRASAAMEYRVAPLRNVSVPLALAWGSELQLTGGIEGAVARIEGEPAHAVGVTAGITGIADILGAEPYLGGITAGWPLIWSDAITGVERTALPEIYLRWSQEF